MHFTAAKARARLPLPPTAKWPDGVFDVGLLTSGKARVAFFAPQGTDYQTVHEDDEFYVITSGDATFAELGQPEREVSAGDLLFVRAGVDHRFTRIGADFATWVIFVGEEHD